MSKEIVIHKSENTRAYVWNKIIGSFRSQTKYRDKYLVRWSVM